MAETGLLRRTGTSAGAAPPTPLRLLWLAALLGLLLGGCGGSDEAEAPAEAEAQAAPDGPPPPWGPRVAGSSNPFFEEWDTPYGLPPFDRIHLDHMMPAFERSLSDHAQELRLIARNPEAPTFLNTLEALDVSGRRLGRFVSLFFSYGAMLSTPQLRAIEGQVASRLTEHLNGIYLDADLYDRVNAVWKNRRREGLDGERLRLLEEMREDFLRAGAGLEGADRKRLADINEELAGLTVRFGQNALAANDGYELLLDQSQLGGLPESVREAAHSLAKEAGKDGWMFKLQRSSITPFLKYSEERDLRREIYQAYLGRGQGGEHDNSGLVLEMARLRAERAALLGYENHAEFVISRNLARRPRNVRRLLDRVWDAALERARQEEVQLSAQARSLGERPEVEPWDWWYLSEKLRAELHDVDDNALRPYFTLEGTMKSAFAVASRLWGLQFVEKPDAPRWHMDVRVWDVQDAEGRHLGLYMLDPAARKGKRGGAWMTTLRDQSKAGGEDVRPLVLNVCNFTSASEGGPMLLSFTEVETLYHEFGHALHGLMSDARYERLSGTAVKRDFVEFPSQMLERWASEPEILTEFALHHETGKPIPLDLVDRVLASRNFNQGFDTVEYVAASYLDLAWHELAPDQIPEDVRAFEVARMNEIGLIPAIEPRYRSSYFQHIFAGGYSAGYYVYLWADAMVADAYAAFRDRGAFDPKLAEALGQILSSGGTRDAEVMFRRLRGRGLDEGALLEDRGLAD